MSSVDERYQAKLLAIRLGKVQTYPAFVPQTGSAPEYVEARYQAKLARQRELDAEEAELKRQMAEEEVKAQAKLEADAKAAVLEAQVKQQQQSDKKSDKR